MKSLKYTIIKSESQYDEYCNILEGLLLKDDMGNEDEIELLTFLIKKWDSENNSLFDLDPIALLKSLMKENGLQAKDLVEILHLSKGTVSKMLNYNRGLSKDTIRKLSSYFNVSQEAFNRPYRLNNEINRRFRDASLMNTRKNLEKVIAIEN